MAWSRLTSGAKNLLEAGGAFVRDTVNGRMTPSDTGDGFVVGSDRYDRDSADTTKDYRFFFNKTKGALRAGAATGSQWDDASVGDRSFAVGLNTNASGTHSHAEGMNTTASNAAAHVEGAYSKATGVESHAEGYGSEASGAQSHAEGRLSVARGSFSHAEGQSSLAAGAASHAEGDGTQALAHHSHARGAHSIAEAYGQSVQASGSFQAPGDSQASQCVARVQTTDATPTALTSGGGVVITTPANITMDTTGATVVLVRAKTALQFRISVIARRTDVEGEMAGFTIDGVVGRDATGSARIIGTPQVTAWGDTGTELWAVDLAVNTTSATNNYLQINATGEAGKTIRWVANIDTTEVRS